ncbi:MAG TPA: lipoate--protein ligase family protein [Candidatus Hydrogenedens sp.]|nr:lipoate--protein ligase family protein [Candidatus Hydrogenedens sp.]
MNTYIIINSFTTPEENIAVEEFLFSSKNTFFEKYNLLRIWECDEYFIVLGSSQKVQDEVFLDVCRQEGIKIIRRCSAGGAVLQGPGCINYSLFLDLVLYPQLRNIRESYYILLSPLISVLRNNYGLHTTIKGISDICFNNKKFSGNAQRRSSRVLLHHGTILYSVNYDLMERVLRIPQKQPEYRDGRNHRDFVGTLPLSKEQIIDTIFTAFGKDTISFSLSNKNIEDIKNLAINKYSNLDWNYRR